MFIKKRTIFAIFVVFSLFCPMGLVSGKTVTDSKTENFDFKTTSTAKWTVMYYMCGDVQDMNGWTDPLIENLTKIKSATDMNIVILNDGFERGDLHLFYIDTTGEKIDITQDFGWPDEVDTSDPNTLELFGKQMMNAYPAEYYCLIPVVSGGSGWKLFCLHDSHDGGSGVSIPVFADTLKNIVIDTNHKIDVIFTSCAMNMIEIAYEFSPYVNYIVGSQDCFSKQYLVQRFYESVGDLRNDTSMTPEEFAKKAPERLTPLSFYYDESYGGHLPLLNRILNKLPFEGLHTVEYYDNTAVVNLSTVGQLTGSINNLSQFLILNNYNSSIKKAVSNARKDVCKFGKCFANNRLLGRIHIKWQFELTAANRFIDVYHFALLLKNNTHNDYLKSLCADVMNSLNKTISAIKKVPGVDCYGLSIYFPSNKLNYNKDPFKVNLPFYEDLKFSQDTNWDEFLKIYLNI